MFYLIVNGAWENGILRSLSGSFLWRPFHRGEWNSLHWCQKESHGILTSMAGWQGLPACNRAWNGETSTALPPPGGGRCHFIRAGVTHPRQQKTRLSRWRNRLSWVFITAKNTRTYCVIHNPLDIVMQLSTSSFVRCLKNSFENVCFPLVNKEDVLVNPQLYFQLMGWLRDRISCPVVLWMYLLTQPLWKREGPGLNCQLCEWDVLRLILP